jgi:hypothetical protein
MEQKEKVSKLEEGLSCYQLIEDLDNLIELAEMALRDTMRPTATILKIPYIEHLVVPETLYKSICKQILDEYKRQKEECVQYLNAFEIKN